MCGEGLKGGVEADRFDTFSLLDGSFDESGEIDTAKLWMVSVWAGPAHGCISGGAAGSMKPGVEPCGPVPLIWARPCWEGESGGLVTAVGLMVG